MSKARSVVLKVRSGVLEAQSVIAGISVVCRFDVWARSLASRATLGVIAELVVFRRMVNIPFIEKQN